MQRISLFKFESEGSFKIKAGKRRSIPRNDDLMALLSSLQANLTCEYVFSLDGHRIDESPVIHKFGKCVRRIGL